MESMATIGNRHTTVIISIPRDPCLEAKSSGILQHGLRSLDEPRESFWDMHR